jgi:hypothetical protein
MIATGAQRRLIVSRKSLVAFLVLLACVFTVFVRFLNAGVPFSYDYGSYLVIIEALSALSFSEMIGDSLVFPYVAANRVIPVEFGFALLVKLLTVFSSDPAEIYATIATVSVGVRIYVMARLGTPFIWIAVLNIYAITMWESNALRLGMAATLLLFGLYKLRHGRALAGWTSAALSVTFHLQTILFLAPFLAFYLIRKYAQRSVKRAVIANVAAALAIPIFVYFLPLIANEKLEFYIAQANSGSSGLTVTSVLAAIFTASALLKREKIIGENQSEQFWILILSAGIPSVLLLLFLTDLGVMGDRAWQLAFIILATFFTGTFSLRGPMMLPYLVLCALAFVCVVNVGVRYPLSDFFSYALPNVDPNLTLRIDL